MCIRDRLRTGDRAICINCGQCANVCPVESIREQPEYGMVAAEIMDAERVVVVSTSPSVRAALGEEFGIDVYKRQPGSIKEPGGAFYRYLLHVLYPITAHRC